ncbi:glucose-6-phosphate dehydrogenase [Salaquimonas pukyongi]|uniref:glucose-6-phosphate dehydrogenase n=1 Tax=Salaquimonas pukyongi TaxID=2712698 RepID=UPI00096BA324|nr:glucose-6-phosphate dehydrogenase [Salaquimonas pukyongi]
MTSQFIPVEPFDYVVFGGTGDLAERKLIPSLFRRFCDGQIPETSRIIGAARSNMETGEYRTFARKAIDEHAPSDDAGQIAAFMELLHYVAVDALSERGWEELKSLLGKEDKVRAFYLAVGPSIFGPIADRLDQHGMVRDRSRLVIEKPIGKDLKSARELNETIGRHFREDQIFRIDHYLGKETVQNLMALRFANTLYQPVWNASFIDHVQITVAESIGVEGRGSYYDKAGAIRDMMQNHLLQLLCLVAMEPPASIDADAVRDEKLKVLRSLKAIDAGNAAQQTVRGQYKAGASGGEAVPGYLDEVENDLSETESFVALKAEIETWRWAGVPFYLRTGKRLPARVSEIVIEFKPVPHNAFGDAGTDMKANRLILRLQPDEGVSQSIMIKDPGPGGLRLRQVTLDMSFAESFDAHAPDAYERLLLDVIRGNQTLFMRRDEVEAAWRWIDPIIEGWLAAGVKPAKYTAGSWGPTASIALIERDGRTWHEGET